MAKIKKTVTCVELHHLADDMRLAKFVTNIGEEFKFEVEGEKKEGDNFSLGQECILTIEPA